MKRAVSLALAGMAMAGTVGAVRADEGALLVRARIVNLQMTNTSEAIPSLSVPADAIEVNDKTIPEVDITYFFTKNIAAELILTYPQKQEVTLSGTKIGTFKHLPPTLTAQYHFLPDGMVRPYVGVGFNYTRISSVSLNVPGVGALDLDKSSIGPAAQIGVDVKIADNLFLNVDIKKIYINSDVKAGGTKVSEVKLNPLAIGVGIGYRF